MSVSAPEQTRRPRLAIRRDPRLHVAVVLPAEALDGRAGPVRRCAPVRSPRARGRTNRGQRAFATVVGADGIFGLVVPIAALVIGDSVLGAEVRAGTFHFTWLSPTPTWQIVLGRWLGGSFVALVTIAPACALAAVVAGVARECRSRVRRRGGRERGVRRVFIAIASLTRRTAVWSLAFVFLVERLLGTALTGIAQLSPTWESRAIFLGFLERRADRIVRTGIPARRRGDRAAHARDDRGARPSRSGAWATCAWPARPTDAVTTRSPRRAEPRQASSPARTA